MEFINALITGLPFLISHLFVTLCLLFLGITSYIFLTPIRELKLIKDGNVAASISFSGALLGIGIPLASSLSVSNSILEIIIWGLTAIFLQLLCFKVTDRFLKDLNGRMLAISSKIKNKIGWKPKISFEEGLKKTFSWYLNNQQYYSKLNKKDITKRIGVKK